jgi:hypothetical protein
VAGIVKQSFPRAKAGKIDALAKAVIAKAHAKNPLAYHGRQAKHKHRKHQSRTDEQGLTVRLYFLPGASRESELPHNLRGQFYS